MGRVVNELNDNQSEVKDRNKIKKSHTLGGVFLLLVLLSIGYLLYLTVNWMLDEERLPLSKMVIQGDLEYISREDVQLVLSQIDNLGTFMSQDVNELQKNLNKNPWVAQAAIRKQWPDLVKIYLVEHKVSAIWNGEALLNLSGDVFHADVAELKENKVKLYGPQQSNKEVFSVWQQITPLFAPLGLNISSLVLNERRAWQVILDNGIRLEIGKESLTERVERFVSLYYQLGTETQRVSYIDLRYDTGAAVGWFPQEELEQENIND